jgi:hypothetical protein
MPKAVVAAIAIGRIRKHLKTFGMIESFKSIETL